ncbi:MAG: hypothetical protein O6922_00895 [Chloroflexi bacterium]|nr:hypothetical protein [Chloroflexota bacterium]
MSEFSSVDALFSWRSPTSMPYRDLRGTLTDAELIALMAGEPRLIRRPILTDGSQIVVGFKPGAYDELI